MKKWEDIPVEELRDVCKRLFEGLWGDSITMGDPIALQSETNPDIRNTDDRVKKALEKIHMERVIRVAKHQLKVNNLDVLLLGVTDEEKRAISVAIKMSVRDYVSPLANLIGFWDDDSEEGETELAHVAEAASEAPVEPPPPPEGGSGGNE